MGSGCKNLFVKCCLSQDVNSAFDNFEEDI